MAAIKKIKIFTEKNSPPEEVDLAQAVVDCGLLGDRYAKGGERQITLIDGDILNWMEQLPIKGLCFARYGANIITENFDTQQLKALEILNISNAQFQVSSCPKECFEECPLRQNNIYCRLYNGSKFLKVIKGGQIKIKDEIKSKL